MIMIILLTIPAIPSVVEFVKVQDWLSGTELSGLNFSINSNLHKKTDLGRLNP